MIKTYIEERGAPELTPSLVFWPNLRFEFSAKRLFLRRIMEQYREPFFQIVKRPEDADFLSVPFEYFDVRDRYPAYLDRVYALAREKGKKVLLFDYTDYVERESGAPENAVLFRVSAYRHHKRKNEIIMPYFVEDFGALPFSQRSSRPVVGFCGLSRYAGRVRALRASVRWILLRAALAMRSDALPASHRGGVFWRMRALEALRRTPALRTAFIERSGYSLHRDSVPGQPERIRAEFVNNLRECHFALCVRGDANGSQRFYEALSAGRIPLFLDTDCVLPLEELAGYDQAIVRVPDSAFSSLGERALEWYAEKDESGFLDAQKRGRALFREYLRLDRFFEIVFDREKSPYKGLLFS